MSVSHSLTSRPAPGPDRTIPAAEAAGILHATCPASPAVRTQARTYAKALGETSASAGRVTLRSGSIAVPISVVFVNTAPTLRLVVARGM